MKALYWELTTRCEEKWNEWDAALRWMVQALVKMAGAYGTDSLPALDFTVSIDHRYPIADDEDAERTLDLQGGQPAGAQPEVLYAQVASQ